MRLIVKTLLILGLAATSIEMTNATIRTCSSARNFLQFVQCKIRRVCLEVSELKHTVNECCSKNDVPDCIHDGQTFAHGSIFTGADGCNTCVCNSGSVNCTNAPGCGQEEGSSYNYRDEIAQAYCAATAVNTFDYNSAVRRDCVGDENTTCADICHYTSTFRDEMQASFPGLSTFGCRGGVWVWFDHPVLAPNPGLGQTDSGLLNMVTISYGAGSCTDTGCGPNYCCCFANMDEK